MWYDFEQGEGGNVFDLARREGGLSYKAAIEQVAKIVGLAAANRLYHIVEFKKELQSKKLSKATKEYVSEEKLARVGKLYNSSSSIEGTLAERYLKEHRGIELDLSENSRYIESAYEPESKGYLPALLAVSRDSENKLRAAQVTYLDKETGNKADIKVKKRSHIF